MTAVFYKASRTGDVRFIAANDKAVYERAEKALHRCIGGSVPHNEGYNLIGARVIIDFWVFPAVQNGIPGYLPDPALKGRNRRDIGIYQLDEVIAELDFSLLLGHLQGVEQIPRLRRAAC